MNNTYKIYLETYWDERSLRDRLMRNLGILKAAALHQQVSKEYWFSKLHETLDPINFPWNQYRIDEVIQKIANNEIGAIRGITKLIHYLEAVTKVEFREIIP
jgi:hypothetical protein